MRLTEEFILKLAREIEKNRSREWEHQEPVAEIKYASEGGNVVEVRRVLLRSTPLRNTYAWDFRVNPDD